MRALFVKTASGSLVPMDDEGREMLDGIPPGSAVVVDVRRERNVAFHRRYMAMMRFGFDHWRPEEAAKDFDAFRGQVMILAGYYDVVSDLRGRVSLVPKSVSFSKMDENEFRKVYKACLNVLWEKIFSQIKRYKSRAQLEAVIEQLLQYE